MFRSHHQDPADDTALTPPAWGLNNSGGNGVRGASASDRSGSPSSSGPIPATAQDLANIYSGVEESGRPRDPHKVEIAGSNPAPATTPTQTDEGSADCLPAICSGGNGGATGVPAEPVSSRDPLTDPRAGDVVEDRLGNVMTIIDATLGHGATVWWSEGPHRYSASHEAYRTYATGGRVIHRAEESAVEAPS